MVAFPLISINFTSFARIRPAGLLKFKYSNAYLFIAFLAVCSMIFYSLAQDRFGGHNYLRYEPGIGLAEGSGGSIEFFRENAIQGKIFNNYDFGSALIFWLYPDYQVFVDNRPEAYSVDFFSNIYKPMQNDKDAWQKYADEYGIDIIFFTHTDGTPWARNFVSAISKDTGWKLVYFDRYAFIMLRDSERYEELIKKYAIGPEEFSDRVALLSASCGLECRFDLADFAYLYGDSRTAIGLASEILDEYPDNPRALAVMGSYFSSTDKREQLMQAINYLEKAVEQGYRLPSLYNQIGLDYFSLGDIAEAKKSWNRSLKIDKDNAAALNYLDQLRELDLY
jgi:tetratricopeptide (TPR) repeat protein